MTKYWLLVILAGIIEIGWAMGLKYANTLPLKKLKRPNFIHPAIMILIQLSLMQTPRFPPGRLYPYTVPQV